MPDPFVPLRGHKYMSLITFRKNGEAVPTAVWFAERDGRLYVMTRSDSWKYKRISRNPQVRVAACTMRGRITGPEISALARILPAGDAAARATLEKKYWSLRIPWLWSRNNIYLEIQPAKGQA